MYIITAAKYLSNCISKCLQSRIN